MQPTAGLIMGAFLGAALLAGATDARGMAAPAGLSDGAALQATSYRVGIGGELRFERGAALKAVPAALARPLAARTEWRT